LICKRSASTSAPHRPHSYKRSRALRRGCSFEPANSTHIRWLWAAYKTGAFPPDGRIPPGLDAAEFRNLIEQLLVELISGGNDAFILKECSGKPIGLMTVWRVLNPIFAPQFHPHVNWFNWATPRNKLECVLEFLIAMKRDAIGIIVAEPEYWPFFGHICHYGVLRRVGTYRGYWADGRDGGIFETVRS
jgi:hypothetical protein